jgi:hypothetical protein
MIRCPRGRNDQLASVKGNRASISLWLAGLVLLGPGVFWFSSCRLTENDVGVAFTKLIRIPLAQLEASHSVTVAATLPDTRAWRRIRRAWGDPGYILAAVSPPDRGLVYCFEHVGIQADVKRNGAEIPLTVASDPPYGFSTECHADGLAFRAPPGSELTVRITALAASPLPAGDLMIMSYWKANTKDRLVRVQIDDSLRTLFTITSLAGLILIAWGGIIFGRRNISRQR